MPATPGARLVPAGRATRELQVQNSRFLAQAGPAATVAAARAFIAEVQAALPAATHHVYAYRLGHGATTTEGQSDAGEPPGTAGRPVLAVVRGSGLGDLVVVVTRFFGGTLLGTGGLVHAYGDAAKAVLAALPRTEKVAYTRLEITVPYALYEVARRTVAAYGGAIADESFAAEVRFAVRLAAEQVAACRASLTDATAGQSRIADLAAD